MLCGLVIIAHLIACAYFFLSAVEEPRFGELYGNSFDVAGTFADYTGGGALGEISWFELLWRRATQPSVAAAGAFSVVMLYGSSMFWALTILICSETGSDPSTRAQVGFVCSCVIVGAVCVAVIFGSIFQEIQQANIQNNVFRTQVPRPPRALLPAFENASAPPLLRRPPTC